MRALGFGDGLEPGFNVFLVGWLPGYWRRSWFLHGGLFVEGMGILQDYVAHPTCTIYNLS